MRELEYFFSQNITLGYDKNSVSDYFFFPPPKSEYFFQQHWESEYFFRKKTIPPPLFKLNGRSLIALDLSVGVFPGRSCRRLSLK